MKNRSSIEIQKDGKTIAISGVSEDLVRDIYEHEMIGELKDAMDITEEELEDLEEI